MFDIRKYKLVSDQIDYNELAVITREAERILMNDMRGAFVELGCYAGTTSLFLQRLLKQYNSDNQFHVYDSFSGLPEKTAEDNSPAGWQFKGGELQASKTQFIKHFRQAGLPLPKIHAGWFEQLTTSDVPNDIIFAFLDGDFYSSIKSSLNVITPQLAKNAVIIIDDYTNEALPGARRAADEWAITHGLTIIPEKSLGIIRFSHDGTGDHS
jgi:O-methyltransferase